MPGYTDAVPGHLVLMAYTVIAVIVLVSVAAQHPFQCA